MHITASLPRLHFHFRLALASACGYLTLLIWNGAIAQLGERYNGIVEVSGSIPLSSTKSPQQETALQGRFFVARSMGLFGKIVPWRMMEQPKAAGEGDA